MSLRTSATVPEGQARTGLRLYYGTWNVLVCKTRMSRIIIP